MTHRISLGSSLRLIACAGAFALSAPLAAQEPRVVVTGGGGNVVFGNGTSPISDETIRALILAHAPEVVQSDSAHSVTLVIDANDQYVSSKVGKATVIARLDGNNTVALGDSTGSGAGGVVIRRTSTSANADAGAAPSASFFKMSTDGAESPDGVFGTGYSMADISSIGMRRFTPGQLGLSTIIVSVVKLK